MLAGYFCFIMSRFIKEMVRFLVLFAILNGFITGAAQEPPGKNQGAVLLEKKDNGKEIKIKLGEVIQIKLSVQGGTGYQWHLDDVTLKNFELLQYQTEPVYKDNRVGGPVWGIWKLKSIKPGEAEVRMDYFRVWEGRAKAADHYGVKIKIEKGSSQ